MTDFVEEVLAEIEGANGGYGGGGGPGLQEMVNGLVEVGAITEVGAATGQLANSIRTALTYQGVGQGLPKPPFGRSARETERRAPLGFREEETGAAFFTLAAAGTSIMRAKVSRVAHVDRLLIVPSAPGVVISSILVGDEEQMLQPNAPVELYSVDSLTDSVPDNFSPIGPALDFSVFLLNTTAAIITGTIGIKANVKR